MKISYLCLLAAAACLAGCGGKSAALDAYRQFSAAYREGKCDVIMSLAEGNALLDAEKFCTSPGKFFGKDLPSAASMAADMAATPQGVMGGWKTELVSHTKSGEDLVLEVVQKPTGRLAMKSTFNTPPQPRHKTVTMSKASGSWKVKEEIKK